MNGRAGGLNLKWSDLATCLLALFVVFLLLKTEAAAVASSVIAAALARASAAILSAMGFAILQNGAELRDAISGSALNVTRACDGLGIFATTSAAALTLLPIRQEPARLAWFLLASFLALQLFNLVRVILLFAALPAESTRFEALHLYVFPLASAAMVGLLGMVLDRRLRRLGIVTAAKWVALACACVVMWYVVAEPVTAVSAVMLAQAWLFVTGSELAIVGEGRDALHYAGAVLQRPFYPTDFTLAMPLAMASALMAGLLRRVIGLALAGLLVSMSLAMALAAIGETWLAFGGTAPALRTVAAGLQDVMVHTNLLLSPWLILLVRDKTGQGQGSLPAKPSPSPKRRRKASNGRG